jgi:hypothetical protein
MRKERRNRSTEIVRCQNDVARNIRRPLSQPQKIRPPAKASEPSDIPVLFSSQTLARLQDNVKKRNCNGNITMKRLQLKNMGRSTLQKTYAAPLRMTTDSVMEQSLNLSHVSGEADMWMTVYAKLHHNSTWGRFLLQQIMEFSSMVMEDTHFLICPYFAPFGNVFIYSTKRCLFI